MTMPRASIRAFSFATALALALLSVLGLASPPAHAASRVDFAATLTGKASIAGVGKFAFDGKGTSSPFGALTNVGKARATGVSVTCVAGVVNTNVATLRFGGGETLVIESLDVACPRGVMRFRGSGTWTVTGGTGRFREAVGNGSLAGRVDFVAGTFTAHLRGRIALAS